MAYNTKLAERVREYLLELPGLKIEEKRMFGGLAFLVNGKMCVNVSGGNLMCRFDPDFQDDLSKRKGYKAMVMRGKIFKGYCYVNQEGIKAEEDFNFWMNVCLDFNKKAKSSKRKK